MNCNQQIKIKQPIFGRDKQLVMLESWANVLISKSEVVSLSILESSVYELPSLINRNIEVIGLEKSVITTNISLENITTRPSKGECEVVVYSSEHLSTVSEMPLNRMELLTQVWIDRYKELQKNPDIKYVLPFENRGEECGVTLHHPHGQIYAYPFIPPVIETEIKAFKKENFLIKIMNELEEKYYVYQNEHFIAAVPPFARYAYEVWIIPKDQIEGPWKFSDGQIEDFSKCIQKVVKGYDSFLNKRCPYIMGLHASPELNDNSFHFHVEFYPPLRHGDKPKILAGSESMAGVFIMDVLPEDSAKVLRKHMS